MLKKDSSSKRSVPSPAVHPLPQALAGGGTSTPEQIAALPQMLNSGKGRNGGSKKSRGLATKSGYDVRTRVSFGKTKKSK